MSSRNADGSVGMMDAAYFTGKKVLLDFFNDLLGLNLQKIEETASGAVACQLTEYIFPGSIPMQRVNWEAKSDYEFVGNYKLLQAAFAKNHVQRHVDVDKLIRAKYQDNLEFCQWLKAFYDLSGKERGDSYDPIAVRAKGKGGKKYNEKMAGIKSKPGSNRTRVVPGRTGRVGPATSTATTTTSKARVSNRSTAAAKTSTSSTRSGMNASKGTKAPLKPTSENKVGSSSSSSKATADAALVKQNAELQNKISTLETTCQDTERERDFYFSKLRNIELLLQIKQGNEFEGCELNDVVEQIFKVLYATAEDNVDIDEDGEVVSDAVDLSQQVSADISAELSEALGGEENLTEEELTEELLVQ